MELTYFPSERASRAERAGSRQTSANHRSLRPPQKIRWLDLLAHSVNPGASSTAKFLSDAAWYFYLFWLPKYLYDARGFRHQRRRRVCLDSLRRLGHRLLAGRMVFEPSGQRRKFTERCPQGRAGPSAAVMPFILLVPRAPVRLGHCPVQPRLFRPAVLVHAGDDSAGRPFSQQRSGRSGGHGRFRRRHGRHRFSGNWPATCWTTASATGRSSRSPATFHVIAFLVITADRARSCSAETVRTPQLKPAHEGAR